HVKLKSSIQLDEVGIVYRQPSTQVDYARAVKSEYISEKELLKAACCNLSESFETSPSVDVSFTDAVTGTRQVQMLGLAGPYTQITSENMPFARGLASIYGLTFVPGTWIEGIQLNKGTGTVVNGFESIAGQINVELRKPEEADRLYLNFYANEAMRLEANANLIHRFNNSGWSTGLLLHGKTNRLKHDRNEDGFLDMPLSNNLIALNRWKYIGTDGLMFQFGVKGTLIDNLGGQTDFDPVNDIGTTNSWGMDTKINRIEGWSKLGKVYLDKPWRTFGLQLSAANHKQESYFGLNHYQAAQNTMYANFIYQSIFGNTNHKFKTGASFQYDDYIESLNTENYDRTEIVPGAYFEYTYSFLEKFSLITGLRGDYHNYYGFFLTPRMHARYAVTDNTVLRASAGRGQRTANILAENNGLLASSRQIVIEGDNSGNPYGLNPEVAWNYGINLTQYFELDYRNGTVSFDYYRTDFQNQIVIDLDQSPQLAVFYNLNGKSYSNSMQVQLDYELINRLDVRVAYRWFDVWTTYDDVLRQKPLVAQHRAFTNLAYESRNHWKYDFTINWQGEKRIPYTGSNPEGYQLDERSPNYVLINAQVSKVWKEKFEVYLGVENLLNYTQENPIIASDDPFSSYFDSSLVWGPIFGRNTYLGLRYKLK
ncbi:MAG: TonB-dependent receptor, partial [Bacteroidota bacterium]